MNRALRADAERSARAILAAAERVLAEDAGASMEQIAEAAGLTRITVHRRFASRQALLDAMAVSAKQQIIDAIEEGRPDSAPALVAMHRVTANVLAVKNRCRFSLIHTTAHTPAAAALWDDIGARTMHLLIRAQQEGLLAPTADLEWTRQVYYALLTEAINKPGQDQRQTALDEDALATLVIDTLLRGAGPAGRPAPA